MKYIILILIILTISCVKKEYSGKINDKYVVETITFKPDILGERLKFYDYHVIFYCDSLNKNIDILTSKEFYFKYELNDKISVILKDCQLYNSEIWINE